MDDTTYIAPSKPKKKTKARRGDGFFESFRDIGTNTVKSIKNDVVKDTAKGIYEQILNAKYLDKSDTNAKDQFDFEQFIKEKEEEARLKGQEEERVFQRATKEFVVFSHEDQKIQQELEQVRYELNLLLETMEDVDANLKKAITQEIVNPGRYHLSFFQKIRKALQLARKSLQDGKLWREMWSSRSNRSYYWKMANTKGTKFMLSHERYMATQAG